MTMSRSSDPVANDWMALADGGGVVQRAHDAAQGTVDQESAGQQEAAPETAGPNAPEIPDSAPVETPLQNPREAPARSPEEHPDSRPGEQDDTPDEVPPGPGGR